MAKGMKFVRFVLINIDITLPCIKHQERYFVEIEERGETFLSAFLNFEQLEI